MVESSKQINIETATLAGGCFWCLEAVYERVIGVVNVESGYIGGHVPYPSYEQVCSGRTGHAEAVKIEYDSGVISYRDILEIFFAIHDPTTLNSQWPDVGTQYRSAIFCHTSGQQRDAELIISELNGSNTWDNSIVTEICPLTMFFKAEEYHQLYYRRNEYAPYCQMVIVPKLTKFRKTYFGKLKSEPMSLEI